MIDLETGKVLAWIPGSVIWGWPDRTRRVKVVADMWDNAIFKIE